LASTDDLVAALRALVDPVFVFKAVRDPDGTVVELVHVFLNESAARLYGKPIEEVLGRGQLELYPSVQEQGLWEAYLGVIESGVPATIDVPWFQENGIKGSFRVTASRFRDGLVVSPVDITEQRQAERALAETSRRFRLLAENASDVVALTRPDGAVGWVSPAVTRALGWAPQDLLGTSLADLVHPANQDVVAAARAAVLSGHEVTTPDEGFVVRMRTKSGEYRWMSGTATPVEDESGKHVGVISGLRNVDDLVQAREAAQADRAALRATVDSLLDPHILLEAVRDETGQIADFMYVEANPAACAYNRMSYQDLIGTRLLELLPGHAGAGLLKQYRHVVETGEPLVLDDIVHSQELMGGEERHYDIRAARVGDGLSYTWRDVTDRHHFAQRLAESEEQYRLLAENASDVIMRLSPDRGFEWLSGSIADVLGWRAPDLIGHLIDEFVHAGDLERFLEGVADATPGTASSVEFRFRRSDGTYQWVACRTRVRVDEDGTPVAMVGGLVDIAARKAAEAKEQERLKEMEQFQRLTIGRELKMIELKKEVEYLRKHGPSDAREPGHRAET
jgi:PAS domain S-box-containing protein